MGWDQEDIPTAPDAELLEVLGTLEHSYAPAAVALHGAATAELERRHPGMLEAVASITSKPEGQDIPGHIICRVFVAGGCMTCLGDGLVWATPKTQVDCHYCGGTGSREA
jgi:hypothetical protein